MSDKAAQQNILSVLKSVLSMQSMGGHSVSEQLMAAGATEEDVKKIRKTMAYTVLQLEAGTTPPNQAKRRTTSRVMLWDQTTSSPQTKSYLVAATWAS